ncbi:hypothetical protein BBK36DRAFT_1143273 [Trichoderma citrinoviride]|uniref:Uncharacterized protein n=1 Tax=Trichoderma citrinoviride TaxID=58853 RepID=A0A2T4B541_9HYPO|nr:hypothetical protein BBK36DRAFT_1143273 [Trichoderma citrinoviride]PTB64456.1 hypothetical protein BBK36DRAFT_1143273 [Trichoderma citrinoviride]
MDESTTHLLTSLLPPTVATLIDTHILSPTSPLQALKRHLLLQARRLQPAVQPVLDRALEQLSSHQAALDVLLPLATVVATVVVLNWVRRLVLWWTRLVFRALFWALVAVFAAWVWNRGVVESARDAAVLGAKVAGYVAVLKDVWVDEYKRYEGQQASGKWDEYSARRSGGGLYEQRR